MIHFCEMNELNKILLPIKITVEALSRKDATLYSAQVAVEFMIKKINEYQSTIGSEFSNNLQCRLDERMDKKTDKSSKVVKRTRVCAF
jgi:hypothetical protein